MFCNGTAQNWEKSRFINNIISFRSFKMWAMFTVVNSESWFKCILKAFSSNKAKLINSSLLYSIYFSWFWKFHTSTNCLASNENRFCQKWLCLDHVLSVVMQRNVFDLCLSWRITRCQELSKKTISQSKTCLYKKCEIQAFKQRK